MPPCHGPDLRLGRVRVPSGPQEKLEEKVKLYSLTFLNFMSFYVYLIQSQVDGSYYKGFSENPSTRLEQHNNKESTYTSAKVPWELVYLEELSSKREALIRERL